MVPELDLYQAVRGSGEHAKTRDPTKANPRRAASVRGAARAFAALDRLAAAALRPRRRERATGEVLVGRHGRELELVTRRRGQRHRLLGRRLPAPRVSATSYLPSAAYGAHMRATRPWGRDKGQAGDGGRWWWCTRAERELAGAGACRAYTRGRDEAEIRSGVSRTCQTTRPCWAYASC